MKRILPVLIVLVLCTVSGAALAKETRIEPAWPVPDYVTWLLEVASAEVGYTEGAHGYSKYGDWAGDPYAQWCAEFLCWCVDQVDRQHGTQLLRQVYPMYSGSNSGRSWFIKNGRYIVRNGNLEDWGYQWMRGDSAYITTGTYIPQPGDWVFFTWTSTNDTDHVAMVEYCARDSAGHVILHVIEGNNPSAVRRNTYDLSYVRILGYGTVHDVADWTMRYGNSGEKVRQLQEKLVYLGLLDAGRADGVFGQGTLDAVRTFQTARGLKVTGIANIDTQRELNALYSLAQFHDPDTWRVDEADDWDDDPDLDDLFGFVQPASQALVPEYEIYIEEDPG